MDDGGDVGDGGGLAAHADALGERGGQADHALVEVGQLGRRGRCLVGRGLAVGAAGRGQRAQQGEQAGEQSLVLQRTTNGFAVAREEGVVLVICHGEGVAAGMAAAVHPVQEAKKRGPVEPDMLARSVHREVDGRH